MGVKTPLADVPPMMGSESIPCTHLQGQSRGEVETGPPSPHLQAHTGKSKSLCKALPLAHLQSTGHEERSLEGAHLVKQGKQGKHSQGLMEADPAQGSPGVCRTEPFREAGRPGQLPLLSSSSTSQHTGAAIKWSNVLLESVAAIDVSIWGMTEGLDICLLPL